MQPQLCANRGIFGIGNPKADDAALKWIRGHSGQIVVAGSGIDAYSTIGRLLKFGINPDRLHFVITNSVLPSLANPTVSVTIVPKIS